MMANRAEELTADIISTIQQRSALDRSGAAFDAMIRDGNGPLLLRQGVDGNGTHSMRDAVIGWIHRQFRSDDPEVIMQRMHEAGFTNFRIYNMGTGDGESRSNHQGGVLVDTSQMPPMMISLTRGTNVPEDLGTHAYDSVSFGLGMFGLQTTLGGYKTNSDRHWGAAGGYTNNGRNETIDEIYDQLRRDYPGQNIDVIFSGSSYGADAASRGARLFGQRHPELLGEISLINYGPASSLNQRERDQIEPWLDARQNYYYDLPGDWVPNVSRWNQTHRPMGTQESQPVEIAHSGALGLRAHLSYYESLSLHACCNYLRQLATVEGQQNTVSALLALYREDPELGMRAIMAQMRANCTDPRETSLVIAEAPLQLNERDRATLASISGLADAGANGVPQEGINLTGVNLAALQSQVQIS